MSAEPGQAPMGWGEARSGLASLASNIGTPDHIATAVFMALERLTNAHEALVAQRALHKKCSRTGNRETRCKPCRLADKALALMEESP